MDPKKESCGISIASQKKINKSVNPP